MATALQRLLGAQQVSRQINVFGVRHLSPMGAWQLRSYLDRQEPDAILIEGLHDATDLIANITRKETRPPIAILAHTDALPVRTVVYPLALYSPEYQVIRWAREHKAHVEFIDLPSQCFLGLQDVEIELMEQSRREAVVRREDPATSTEPVDLAPEPKLSLYSHIAELAGERRASSRK
jgi:hypothetical protein